MKVNVICWFSKNMCTASKSTAFHIYSDNILFTRNVRQSCYNVGYDLHLCVCWLSFLCCIILCGIREAWIVSQHLKTVPSAIVVLLYGCGMCERREKQCWEVKRGRKRKICRSLSQSKALSTSGSNRRRDSDSVVMIGHCSYTWQCIMLPCSLISIGSTLKIDMWSMIWPSWILYTWRWLTSGMLLWW